MYDKAGVGKLYIVRQEKEQAIYLLTKRLRILNSMFPARKVKQCTSHEIGVCLFYFFLA